MTEPVDFEALRKARNESIIAQAREAAAELGATLEECNFSFDVNACYCACTTGGPCEHKWDGPMWESDRAESVTCSRCGTTAMSHSMRTGL